MTDAADQAIRASLETSLHRDRAELARRLTGWLAARSPGAQVTAIEVPGTSGASSEIFFLSLAGTVLGDRAVSEAVLRLSPAYAVYPVVDLSSQFRCMDLAARHSAAPVAAPLAFEADGSVLGAPFLLMERKRGRGAPDWPSYVREGWIHDLAPPDQSRLWRAGVEAIAALHATELPTSATGSAQACADLKLPMPGVTLLDQSIAYWRRYLEFVSAGGDYPVLHAAVEWLEREQPVLDLPPKLVWGDASLRNMLFEGLQPCALMDFEFSHVGLYPFDIAFYAMMDHVMAEGFAEGAPRLPGFAGIGETLDCYEAVSGMSVPARGYFLRMALTYMSLATTRVFQRLAREGRIPPEMVGANPPLRILTEVTRSGILPR